MSRRAITICLTCDLNTLLSEMLTHYNTEMVACASPDEAQRFMLRDAFCLIVLNVAGMTAEHPETVVRRIRQDTYAPILVLVRDETDVPGLVGAGADVWLRADTAPEHILSSMTSLHRRYTLYNHYDALKPEDAVIHRGQLSIDHLRHRVTLSGREVSLQPRQFRLLLYLARNPGIVFSAERIGSIIWPDSYDQNRDVSALIAELRGKLEDDWEHPTYIETVHGVGYRFLPKW